jgi:TonB family protein
MKTLALALLLPVLGLAQEQSNSAAANPVSGDSVGSPAVDPALAADIRRLLDDAGVTELMRQQINLAMQPTIALMKQNPNLPPRFVDETMQRAKEKLLGPEIEEMAVEAYAKFFTRDDVQQMIAYQESPIGRKIKQVNPQMLAELSGRVSVFAQNVGRDAAAEVIKEHPEYLKKPESAEPATPPQSAAGGVMGGILGSTTDVAPRTQTQFNGPHLEKQQAVARLLKKVEPAYPPLAKAARVQGTVSFTVVIGVDGKVENLQLVRGHPLLVNAAKDAVLQWEYEPFLLDGKPVRAITDVEVEFHLDMS